MLLVAAISYDPIVHVSIGPLSISPHGVGIAVGFLLGARLLLPATRRIGISDDTAYTILIRAAIGSMIGARLAYVVNHLGDYLDDPVSVLKVWEGGISLLGGIFGAMLLALPAMRKQRVDLWRTLDAAAPGLALGIIVGRVGDLIVADHLGKPTSFFLGYRCPPPSVDTASPCVGAVVHQTALYDLLLTAALLTGLLLVRRRAPDRYDGGLIIMFGAVYGVFRLLEDFLREDLRRFGLTGSQITAIVTLAVCWGWLLLVRRTPKWGHWERLPDGTPKGTNPPEAPPTMAAPEPTYEEP